MTGGLIWRCFLKLLSSRGRIRVAVCCVWRLLAGGRLRVNGPSLVAAGDSGLVAPGAAGRAGDRSLCFGDS